MPRQREKTQNTAAQETGENSMIKWDSNFRGTSEFSHPAVRAALLPELGVGNLCSFHWWFPWLHRKGPQTRNLNSSLSISQEPPTTPAPHWGNEWCSSKQSQLAWYLCLLSTTHIARSCFLSLAPYMLPDQAFLCFCSYQWSSPRKRHFHWHGCCLSLECLVWSPTREHPFLTSSRVTPMLLI